MLLDASNNHHNTQPNYAQLVSSSNNNNNTIHIEHKHVSYKGLKRKLTYLAIYYVLAVIVAIFNKQVIGRTSFGFPLMLSALSAFVQSGLALSSLLWLGCLKKTFNKLTAKQYFTAIVPCAVASGLDIGISNSSLQFVSLSFYTMVKSSAPIFVLACALALGLEKPSVSLFVIMGIIAGGTLMTVWSDSTGFDVHGFSMVLSAAMLSGVRWSLTQLIIEEHSSESGGKKLTSAGPLATILYLAPIAGCLMMLLSCLVEGLFGFLKYFQQNFVYSLSIFGSSGVLTFLLILTEYKVVQETSVLTFAITGIFKEIMLIGLSMLVFGDRLILINYVGIAISISGIAGYNYLRLKLKAERHQKNPSIPSSTVDSKIMLIPPAEPLQSFIEPKDVSLSKETEELYIAQIMNDDDLMLDGMSTMNRVKTRLSAYLKPFGPHSEENLMISQ